MAVLLNKPQETPYIPPLWFILFVDAPNEEAVHQSSHCLVLLFGSKWIVFRRNFQQEHSSKIA
jgi:hypothetical protein